MGEYKQGRKKTTGIKGSGVEAVAEEEVFDQDLHAAKPGVRRTAQVLARITVPVAAESWPAMPAGGSAGCQPYIMRSLSLLCASPTFRRR
jgi:hypothetical protein